MNRSGNTGPRSRGVTRASRVGVVLLLAGFGPRVMVFGPAPAAAQTPDPAARALDVADSAIVALDTTDVASINRLGYALLGSFGAGDVRAATEVFRINTERSPEVANVWDSYGEALARRGDIQAALDAYRKALALDPGMLGAQSAVAMLLAYRGEVDAGLAFNDAVIRAARARSDSSALREGFSTRSALFITKGLWSDARATAEERIAFARYNDATTTTLLDHSHWDYHLLGNLLLGSGDPDAADSIYDLSLARAEATGGVESVLNAVRHNRESFRSEVAIHRQQWERAIELASFYREDNPNYFSSITGLAHTALGRGDLAADTILALGRDGYYRSYVLSRARLAQGDTAAARRLLQEVVTFNQLGAWYWLHEYALIKRQALGLLDSINGGTPWH